MGLCGYDVVGVAVKCVHPMEAMVALGLRRRPQRMEVCSYNYCSRQTKTQVEKGRKERRKLYVMEKRMEVCAVEDMWWSWLQHKTMDEAIAWPQMGSMNLQNAAAALE
ncbi:hypothetical protein LR48_Vigan07g232600 [Vigna angularis]|uniref:Uncharacterized protein n=1 Tax=Phaseolus angularis TaxID=3914 RepID=A0A0L9V194_PHAAN|nr:hypothetical protein LR48_Vigan07g232600 [Vigna angularis]